MQIWAESGKSALPICNYSQVLYQFLTFTQNLKRSPETIQKNRCNQHIYWCYSDFTFLKLSQRQDFIMPAIFSQDGSQSTG